MIDRYLTAGLCTGLLIFTGQALQAAMVVQNIPVPGQSLIAGVTTDTTFPFDLVSSFNNFDPLLGTLTNVRFDFTYDFQLTLQTPPTGGGGAGSAGGPIFVNGVNPPGGGGGNGTGGGGGPSVTLQLPFSVTGNFQVSDNLGSYLAAFPGQQSTFDFSATGHVGPDTGATGALDLKNTSSVVVTYTYTPAPEPATASLLGVAFLALARSRVRRQ